MLLKISNVKLELKPFENLLTLIPDSPPLSKQSNVRPCFIWSEPNND
jgi:hypothetical protein